MMDDVENGKIGVCIMKDLTRWGRDYLQVGNAMEIFRRNNVRFIAVNNGIDSEKPDTLEFAHRIGMPVWFAKRTSLLKFWIGVGFVPGSMFWMLPAEQGFCFRII